jgi:hypothetical protein
MVSANDTVLIMRRDGPEGNSAEQDCCGNGVEYRDNYLEELCSGQGASGSKLLRIAITTSRIRALDKTRLSRSSNPRLEKVCMKWPFTNDGPGSPVSPGDSGTTVAPTGPLLFKGTIRTVSVLSLRFLPSSEMINTQ